MRHQYRITAAQVTAATPNPTQTSQSNLPIARPVLTNCIDLSSSEESDSPPLVPITTDLPELTSNEVENILGCVEHSSNRNRTTIPSVVSQPSINLTQVVNQSPLVQQQTVYIPHNPPSAFHSHLPSLQSRRHTPYSTQQPSHQRSLRQTPSSSTQTTTYFYYSPQNILQNRPVNNVPVNFIASSSLGSHQQQVVTTSITSQQQIFHPHTSIGNGNREHRGYIRPLPTNNQRSIRPSQFITHQTHPTPRSTPRTNREFMATSQRPTNQQPSHPFYYFGNQSSHHHRFH